VPRTVPSNTYTTPSNNCTTASNNCTMYNSNSYYETGVHKHNISTKFDTSNQPNCSSYKKKHFTCEYKTKIVNHFSILIVGIYIWAFHWLSLSVTFSGYMTNILINQHLSTHKNYTKTASLSNCFLMADPSVPSALWLLSVNNANKTALT